VSYDHQETLSTVAAAISGAVATHQRRGYSGQRETQYHLDLEADAVAVSLLTAAGYRVVSEESGTTGHGEFTVVVDPIDGSTNCDRGVPFYATSLAVLRGDELVAGLVRNQATGTEFYGERGAGATRDGHVITTSGCTTLADAVVAWSGSPQRNLAWNQNRALGAASLEICLVADGSLDAFGVAGNSLLHPWDYLAGLIIATESGAAVHEYRGEDLVTVERVPRRPLFAATTPLLDELVREGML
jgi:myo-inositol-1(or 4)-monophosphatase